MTDQIGRNRQVRFTAIEVASVAAVTLVLVMVAVPESYVDRKHTPSLHAASGGPTGADGTENWNALQSAGTENEASSAGDASQGSPFEVRTVGRREFCADMPGVVRFSTSGPSCKNGTIITNEQRKRDQPAKP